MCKKLMAKDSVDQLLMLGALKRRVCSIIVTSIPVFHFFSAFILSFVLKVEFMYQLL